ncbi:MAG: hypothetical protein AAGA66_13145 [Bacteroidota bacterium]
MDRLVTTMGIGLMLVLVIRIPTSAQCDSHLKDDSYAFLQVVETYFDLIGESSPLYRGVIYSDRYRADKHPFLEENEWTLGTITYDGVYYPSVYLKYDLVNQLVITTYDFNTVYQLESEKIKQFELRGLTFTKMDPMKTPDNKNVFYELVHCNRASFLVSRRKSLKEVKDYQSLSTEYPEEDRYYILKDDVLHKVGGKRSVLTVLEDRKKELKSYVAKNNLLFSGNTKGAIHRMVSYYNSLP